jgi:integrase
MAKKKAWSYSTGERGRNRVRAYEDAKTGSLLLEFYERDLGEQEPRRKRVALGHRDREVAKRKADELAAALASTEAPRGGELSLRTLFDMYLAEVTPSKGDSKAEHDRRAAAMFLAYFGTNRKAKTLSRRDWDRFIADRRVGRVTLVSGKASAVGDRQIGYDLGWLQSVLRWATLAGDERGGFLLDRNPLQGLSLPKNASPKRPVIVEEQYDALLRVADEVSPLFRLALVLANETGHRIGAIRHLRWADVDLDRGTVLWRDETDKLGFEHTTLLSDVAAAALREERGRVRAIGDAWVFPAPGDPSYNCSRHLMRDWWERGAKLAGLPEGQRIGWHSLRRKFATELKSTPLKDLCAMGGWKNPQTVLTCYQYADEETQRAAMAKRTKLRATG